MQKRKGGLRILISNFSRFSRRLVLNIHIFDYPDSRLSGLFTEVPTCPDNRGLTVTVKTEDKCIKYTSDRLKAKSPLPESKSLFKIGKGTEVKEHVMFVIKPSYLNNLYF